MGSDCISSWSLLIFLLFFNDDSRSALSIADGRPRVGRRENKRNGDCCVRAGNGSVWLGQFDGEIISDLVVMQVDLNARRYIDDVLRTISP